MSATVYESVRLCEAWPLPQRRTSPARAGHVVVKLSRAVKLMKTLLRDHAFTEDQLAVELVVRPRTIAHYREGTEAMPLDRQMCLALLLLTLSDKYARSGIQLRDQVRAAMRFEQRDTAIMTQSPPRPWGALRPSGPRS